MRVWFPCQHADAADNRVIHAGAVYFQTACGFQGVCHDRVLKCDRGRVDSIGRAVVKQCFCFHRRYVVVCVLSDLHPAGRVVIAHAAAIKHLALRDVLCPAVPQERKQHVPGV